MIKINEAAKAFLKSIGTSGMGGVDINPCGESPEEWTEDYAIFLLECDTFAVEDEQCEYIQFNSDKFWSDLKKKMQEVFGEDVEIVHYPSCDEWEIIRRKPSPPTMVRSPAKKVVSKTTKKSAKKIGTKKKIK